MAFFVGGQLVFGLAVVPVLRGDAGRERMRAVAASTCAPAKRTRRGA